MLSAYCLLLRPAVGSELVFIVVIVQVFLFDDVKLNWIQPDYFQIRTAFLTRNEFALICVSIYVDIRITFGTYSNRHFVILRNNLLPVDVASAFRQPILSYMIGPDNLTSLAAFCNTLFHYF
jgi:hypothetical protein